MTITQQDSTQPCVSWWRHQMETFSRNWPFVRGIHRSPVNSPHKGQWRGALIYSLICVWIKGWENNREAGDLRRYRAHYDVIVILFYGYTVPYTVGCHVCHHATLITTAVAWHITLHMSINHIHDPSPKQRPQLPWWNYYAAQHHVMTSW